MTTGDYIDGVKVVGIKRLKARLSGYVRLVKAGETGLVTERDEVVAELRPARRQTPVGGPLEETLEALAASGEVIRAAQAGRLPLAAPEAVGGQHGGRHVAHPRPLVRAPFVARQALQPLVVHGARRAA